MTRVSVALLAIVLAHAAPAFQSLECATGWSNEVKVIPEEWINDGYCDCPLDGSDEPYTQACSGSESWPGIPASKEESASPQLSFACPEQPKLKLPLSRVHDGICDCCDGADEPEGACQDICEQVLKAEREARVQLEKGFAVGSNKRKHELYAFKKLREEKLKVLEELQAKQATFDTGDIQQQINQLKQNYMIERMQTVKSVVTGRAGFLNGLDAKALRAFVMHACQVAGEMSGADDSDTCAALRLAGLDLGMTWGDDNFDQPNQMKPTTKISQDLASLLFDNAAHNHRGWSVDQGESENGKGGRRRRLSEESGDNEDEYPDDDDYMGMGDDDYHGSYDDYDNDMEDDEYAYTDHRKGSEHHRGGSTSQQELEGQQKIMVDAVKSVMFSSTRMAFLNRANDIADEISKILDAQRKEEKEETADEEDDAEEAIETENEENKQEDLESPAPTYDPTAYTMVKSYLRRKEEIIQKGFKWGASALLFFSAASETSDEELLQLAIGTVYYGNLSAIQVWQILQKVVDEFIDAEEAPSPETCASPWAGACPPKQVTHNGVSMPASSILEAAEAFCSGVAEASMEGLCAAAPSDDSIPTSIPDGYYGYYAPVARDASDPLTIVFAPLGLFPVDKDGLESLETQKGDLEKEQKDVEREINDTWKDIGGSDGESMGPNGELQSLADKCFDVLQGKYTYEVCVFGEAKQKEGKPGGTNLGKWTKMTYDDETGERIMYWENGAKCWNGPKRSATVYLTCGAETKVLSADEPDTCRYVLQVESHIACDDLYKQRMGL